MYDCTQFVVLKQDIYPCRLTNRIFNRENIGWNLCSRVFIYKTMINKQQQQQQINKLPSYAR